MFRKSALAMAMLGALTTGKVVALGLGEMQLESALNQPLKAEVELLSATPAELNELKVSVGSAQAFENAGIERPLFLNKLKFDVSKNTEGKPVVRITSRDVVREPFLDFLLEVSWSKGRLLREYTVLVDPPVTMPAPPPVPRAPAIASSNVTSQPVAPARRVTHTAQMPPVAVAPGEYRTKRNDTLWQVAQEVRPDTDVSMEQAMLGLLRTNPEAFYGNNINNLKAGYVLRVPDRGEMTSISKAEALRESRAQYAQWREARNQPPVQQAASGEATGTTAAMSGETAGEGAQLQLVAPDMSEAGSAGGSADQVGKLDAIERDLMMANEAVEAERRRGDELSGRLAVLEEQIRNMQRLIQLKDDELAQLQARAGGAPAEASVDEPGMEADIAESEIGPLAEESEADVDAAGDAGEVAMDAASAGADELGVDAGSSELLTASDQVESLELMSADPTDVPAEAPLVDELSAPAEPDIMAEAEPVAPATETTPGFVDRLLANPLWLGAGAVVLALLAFFGLRRKRGVETGFQESILQASQDRSASSSDSEITSTSASAAGGSNETSLLSEFAVSDMGSLKHGGEADPLAEADVYLAYGRFQQAEDLISDALENNPKDENLNLKLLEVHLAAKNQSAFDEHAEAILARLENSSDPMWEKVAEMGRELNPENPLYQSGSADSSVKQEFDDIDALDGDVSFDSAESDVEAKADADEGLDFDIDLAMDGDRDDNEDHPDSVEFTPPEVASDLTFDMDSVEPDHVEQANAPEFDLEDLDFDAGEESAADEGDGELTSLDEVSTKLDLARAYIDMGDPDGARNILDEVIDEGTDDQKTEAKGIMEQIS